MLQLDFSDPVNTLLTVAIVLVVVIWIAAELKLEGGARDAIRVVCALVLSVLFMALMVTLGLIVF
ncbi:MAG: hypothetical protein ACFFCK_08285 [Promethearchaeota archaeon]